MQDTYVTAGNINDVDPYVERIKEQIEKFGFQTKSVGIDAGYNTSYICKSLWDMGINAATGYRRSNRQKDSYGKYMFRYIPEWESTSALKENIWSTEPQTEKAIGNIGQKNLTVAAVH